MGICLKELRESRRWLRLIHSVPLLKSASQVEPLITETESLIKIFFTSIRTAKQAKLKVARRTSNIER
jgi:four helix bundle protein